jgi:hypothetical protein
MIYAVMFVVSINLTVKIMALAAGVISEVIEEAFDVSMLPKRENFILIFQEGD